MSSQDIFPNADTIRLLWKVVRNLQEVDGVTFRMRPEEVENLNSAVLEVLRKSIATPADVAFFAAHTAVEAGWLTKDSSPSPCSSGTIHSAANIAATLQIDGEPSPEFLDLIEVLARSASAWQGNQQLMAAIAARFIREGHELPPVLREFAASTLDGTGLAKRRGRPPLPSEDVAICRIVDTVLACFPGVPIRGDHEREVVDDQPRSVCDLVALALRSNGVPFKTPSAIYQAHRRGKRALGSTVH